MLETAPPKPTLNLLVIGDNGTLQVPDSSIKQWYHDNRFGERFKTFIDGFNTEFGKAPLPHPSRTLHPPRSVSPPRAAASSAIGPPPRAAAFPAFSYTFDGRWESSGPRGQDSAGSKRSLEIGGGQQNGVSPDPAPNPTKRLKLDLDVRAIGDLPGPVIMDVPLVSIKGKGVKLVLSIRPNNAIFLLNMGAGEAPCPSDAWP